MNFCKDNLDFVNIWISFDSNFMLCFDPAVLLMTCPTKHTANYRNYLAEGLQIELKISSTCYFPLCNLNAAESKFFFFFFFFINSRSIVMKWWIRYWVVRDFVLHCKDTNFLIDVSILTCTCFLPFLWIEGTMTISINFSPVNIWSFSSFCILLGVRVSSMFWPLYSYSRL